MLAGVAAALVGCGSKTHTVTTVETVTAPASSTAASATSTVTTDAAGQMIYGYRMPVSSTPTRCSVWLQGQTATIFFSSSVLNVKPACDSWVQSSGASDELWIEGEQSALPDSELSVICTLSGAGGEALAVVKDQSNSEDVYGREACSRLVAGGTWTER